MVPVYSIAGVDFRFTRVDPQGAALLGDYAHEFALHDAGRSAPGELAVSLRMTADPLRPSEGENEPVVTRRPSDVLLQRFDIDCLWRPEAGTVEATCWAERTSVGSLLRMICGLVLPRRGGLLVHASSVVSGGHAFLFPGPSGAGKTTIASLGGSRPVLCDEISAVSPTPDGYVALPTPFFGEMPRRPRADGAPLRAIGRPTKNPTAAEPPRLVPIGAAVALAEVLHCAVAFDESPAGRREVVEAAATLVTKVPAYDVHFSLERDPWELLDGLTHSAS